MTTAFLSKITYPGTSIAAPLPTYFDLTLISNPYYSGVFDGWCVNESLRIGTSQTGLVNLYPVYSPASGYTALNTAIPACLFVNSSFDPDSGAIFRLDNVSWLLNQRFTDPATTGGTVLGKYSWSEVSIAVWRLLGFTAVSGTVSYETQEADVQFIVNIGIFFTTSVGLYPLKLELELSCPSIPSRSSTHFIVFKAAPHLGMDKV